MSHNKSPSKHTPSWGFTLIEMLVVAPLVILIIVAFVSLVLTTTGAVLVSKSQSTLVYNIQDTLNRIEQDTKQSGAFLSTDNITLPTGSVQGYNNSSTGFENVSSTQTGTALILNSYATSTNPVNIASVQPLYASNQPNACASSSIAQNTLVYLNIVYFVQNGSLWRRVIVPAGYPGTANSFACGTPWQQASCSPGYTASAYCSTNDIDLVDGVSSTGFTVNYYPTSSSTVASSVASDPTKSDPVRQAAMNGTNTIGVSITASQTVAGRSFTQSASLRITALNNDPTATITAPVPTITTQPSSTSVATGSNATFSVVSNPSTGVSYQWQQSVDAGATFQNVTGGTSSTLSVSATSVYMNLYEYRVIVDNAEGTVTSSAATMTVTTTGWTTFTMQNGWGDYGLGYDTNGFRITSAGVVILKGLIMKAGIPSSGEVIGNLPLGYRPSETLIFGTSTSSNAAGRVDILSNGNVVFQIGSQAWFSLENITFLPSTTSYTFNAIPLTSPWVYVGTPYAAPAYAVDSLQRVHLKGIVKGGTGNIAPLPTGARSAPDLYFETDSNNGFGDFVTASSAGEITPPSYNNAFVSLQEMYYSSSFTGWTALAPTGAWSNYGSSYPPLEYTKASDGLVTVQGFVKGGAVGSTIATLPAGYRPALTLLSAQTGYDQYSRVDVMNTGTIVVQSLANSAWLSLNNLTFYADN